MADVVEALRRCLAAMDRLSSSVDPGALRAAVARIEAAKVNMAIVGTARCSEWFRWHAYLAGRAEEERVRERLAEEAKR